MKGMEGQSPSGILLLGEPGCAGMQVRCVVPNKPLLLYMILNLGAACTRKPQPRLVGRCSSDSIPWCCCIQGYPHVKPLWGGLLQRAALPEPSVVG